MSKNIAVIGATGSLGKPVAIALAASGFTVSALVRDLDKARAKLPAEINMIKGDIKNAADLLALMNGQDFLYINLNLKLDEKKNDWHAETDGLKTILAAAEKSKIKRIGFISSIVMRYQGMNTFNWWVFDMKQEAIKLIKASPLPYTIFYPSTFMENFEGNYRRGNSILLAGESKHKMYFIAAADFGKQVANSFERLRNENKEYDIQGLEAFTADEASLEFIKHYKKATLKISRAPLPLLRFIGKFVQRLNYAAHIIEAMNNYPEKFSAENTWRELGKPEITLKEFAENSK
ncbi:MAG TPA: NmrA family NAD(P)-binding protein [Chryseosolibacter sp.]